MENVHIFYKILVIVILRIAKRHTFFTNPNWVTIIDSCLTERVLSSSETRKHHIAHKQDQHQSAVESVHFDRKQRHAKYICVTIVGMQEPGFNFKKYIFCGSKLQSFAYFLLHLVSHEIETCNIDNNILLAL